MTARTAAARRATVADLYELMVEIQIQLGGLTEAVGKENDKGDGGTGLAGKVARLNRDVGDLTALRNKAAGAMLAVTLLGALLILGLKSWIAQVAQGR